MVAARGRALGLDQFPMVPKPHRAGGQGQKHGRPLRTGAPLAHKPTTGSEAPDEPTEALPWQPEHVHTRMLRCSGACFHAPPLAACS
jgi:hypothetical protein